MKHSRAFTVLLLCLSLSPAAASEFEDYRIPESSWRRYNVSIGGFGSRTSRNQTGEYDRVLNGLARFGGGISLVRDSERLQWAASATGALDGEHHDGTSGQYLESGPTGLPPPGTVEWESETLRTQRLNEFWRLGGSTRWYPGASRIGFYGSGALSGQEEQRWSGRGSESGTSGPGGVVRSASRQSSEQWTYREVAEVQAGIGLGKVRDATPVFLTILLEERLQRDGKLQRAATPPCRQRLAELFSLRFGFSTVHGLPEKFFWSEVERLLREDGALGPDGLDAYAAQHVDEDLAVARSAFVRQVGWFIGPSLSARHQHVFVRENFASSGSSDDGVSPPVFFDIRSSARQSSSFETIGAGGNAEYYRPLGPRMQANLSITALAGVAGDEDLLVSGQARIQRLVGERWFAEAYAINSRSIVDEDAQPSMWSVLTGGAISYFLEDYCRAEFSLDRIESVWDYATPFLARTHDVDVHLQLTLNLGRGRLDAPGLMPPVRPLN